MKKLKFSSIIVLTIILTLGLTISLNYVFAAMFQSTVTGIQIGNTTLTEPNASDNLIYGIFNDAGSNGSFMLLQEYVGTSYVDRFKIDNTGKITTSGDVCGNGICLSTVGGAMPGGSANQTLRHNGTAWEASSFLKVGANGDVTITTNSGTTYPDITLAQTGAAFTWYAGVNNDTYRIGRYIPFTWQQPLTITNNGRVGIGNATPSYNLDVSGDIRSTGVAYLNSGFDITRLNVIAIQNNTTLASGMYTNNGDGLYNAAGSGLALGSWWHLINMHHSDNNGFNAQIAVPLTASPNEIFWRNSSGGTWTEWRKVISENSAGNVGIGMTNQSYKLDVAGDIHMVSGNFIHNSIHGNIEVMQLLAANNGGETGNAGFYSWISEPGITWTGAGIGRNMYNSGATFARVNPSLTSQMMRFDEGTGVGFTVENTSGTRNYPLYFDASRMEINGKVGIGTAGPNSSLHIYQTSGNNAEIDIQSSGNYWGIYHDRTTDELRFWRGSNLAMITNSGAIKVSNLCDENGLNCKDISAGWGSGGSVTSISQGTGMSFSSNPITTTGTISANTSYLQRRVSSSCAAGSSIRVINSDGTVTCETDDTGSGGFSNPATADLNMNGYRVSNALQLHANGNSSNPPLVAALSGSNKLVVNTGGDTEFYGNARITPGKNLCLNNNCKSAWPSPYFDCYNGPNNTVTINSGSSAWVYSGCNAGYTAVAVKRCSISTSRYDLCHLAACGVDGAFLYCTGIFGSASVNLQNLCCKISQ